MTQGDYRPVIITQAWTFIPIERMLFVICPVCLNEVNWQHTDASFELVGACCAIVHRATPANKSMKTYLVKSKPANMKNVHWLHREKPSDLRKG